MGCMLVTGGAGFIGSNFVHVALAQGHRVINVDKLTYAGNRDNLTAVAQHPEHRFVHMDICDQASILQLMEDEQVHAVVHFAAESHVD